MNKKSKIIYIYNTNSFADIHHKKKLAKKNKNREKFLRSIRKSHSLGLVSNIYQQQSGSSLKFFQGGSVGSRR